MTIKVCPECNETCGISDHICFFCGYVFDD